MTSLESKKASSLVDFMALASVLRCLEIMKKPMKPLQMLLDELSTACSVTEGKRSLKNNLAKEDLSDNSQRDDLTGFKFYLDENWSLVYLPEAVSSANSSRNQAKHQPTVVPVTMASQHQLQPTLGQMPDLAHYVWRSSVKRLQPEQFALHDQPPQPPVEVHAPHKPEGNDQVPFRPRDLSWKYACRVPNGKTYNAQCILCGKIVCSISRMKEHLACTGRTASPCPCASNNIREEIADYLFLKKNPRFHGASSSADHGAA